MARIIQKQGFQDIAFSNQWVRFSAFVAIVFVAMMFLVRSNSLLRAADDEPVKVTTKRDSRRATLPVQVAKIDTSMVASWADNKIKPSPLEDDVKWCRRIFLDVIGRIPSYDEFAEFAKDKSPDKKLVLVNRLLNDSRYTPNCGKSSRLYTSMADYRR